MRLEEQLRAYADLQDTSEEEKIQKAIRISKEALYKSQAETPISGLEFLFQQAGYIQKRWWLAQAVILAVLWYLLYISKSTVYIQRSMGTAAALFVILLIPELWKNQKNMSMEIEGTTCFFIRKIYAARMLLFTMADMAMLSVFVFLSVFTLELTVSQMIIQFFLPMNVTCCICFRNLYTCREGSDYLAFVMSLIWSAIWMLVILNENVYGLISVPAWAGSIAFSAAYLVYCLYRVWKSSGQYWEVNSSWN